LVAVGHQPTPIQRRAALESGIDEVMGTPVPLWRLRLLLQETGWATRPKGEIDEATLNDHTSCGTGSSGSSTVRSISPSEVPTPYFRVPQPASDHFDRGPSPMPHTTPHAPPAPPPNGRFQRGQSEAHRLYSERITAAVPLAGEAAEGR